MSNTPDQMQLDALQSFANRNGREWKTDLSILWGNGRDYYEPEGNQLHAVRNQFGPSWLFDECKILYVPKGQPGKYGKIDVAVYLPTERYWHYVGTTTAFRLMRDAIDYFRTIHGPDAELRGHRVKGK